MKGKIVVMAGSAEHPARWSGTVRKSGDPWSIEAKADGLAVTIGNRVHVIPRDAGVELKVRCAWFMPIAELRTTAGASGLGRISRSQARQMLATLRDTVFRGLCQWYADVSGFMDESTTRGAWIEEEAIRRIEETRPSAHFRPRQLATAPDCARDAYAFARLDLRMHIADVNEGIVQSELNARREFFDKIESSPLTEEQARAVICFDNRVQVIAAAGSGKTSVMIARAAYAVDKGLVAPNRILLLAFNKAAADELQTRITERFVAAGLQATGVRASTFHSFGLSLIGKATGKKPRVPSWVEPGADVGTISQIANGLRTASAEYDVRWDLFRLLYAPLRSDDETASAAEGEIALRTFGGESVKSHGERLIADWLWMNGVEYKYEAPYVVVTATPERSQYHPDFYYPDLDTWHEHWALDSRGEVPATMPGYRDGMRWKRKTHASNRTDLIETTYGGIRDGSAIAHLEKELRKRGVEPDFDPGRTPSDAVVVKDADLYRLMRTFMAHVKSNGWTRDGLDGRLASTAFKRLNSARTRMFLELFWPILDEWNRRLAEGGYVDFDDMLTQAAGHIGSGKASNEYDLILVDEFQDSSRARTRLLEALVASPGKYLLAVGDDWQAINRFAGADLASMTEFGSIFGTHQSLALQTTFRCTQEICDVSSTFVRKNPEQLDKGVSSASGPGGTRIRVEQVGTSAAIGSGVQRIMDSLADRVRSGELRPHRGATLSVFVLGRYGFDRDYLSTSRPDELRVEFRTVHSSKGLEADVVIIPNLTIGIYGFPSGIEDDPVLELALSGSDSFEHADERRLFYVAMTRARQEVILVGVSGQESPFLVELATDGLVDGLTAKDVAPKRRCPSCGHGTLVERRGPFGTFIGCTSYSSGCKHTEKIGGASASTLQSANSTASGKGQVGGPCPTCLIGTLVSRHGYNEFVGCSEYPNCRHTQQS